MSHLCLTGRSAWSGSPPGSVWSSHGQWFGWAASPQRKGSAARPCTTLWHRRRPLSMRLHSEPRSRTSVSRWRPPNRLGSCCLQLCNEDEESVKVWAVSKRAEEKESTYRWALMNATLPTRLACQDHQQTNSPLKFFAEQLKYWPGNRTQTKGEICMSWNVYFLFLWLPCDTNMRLPWLFFKRIFFLVALISLIRTTV